MIIHTRVAKTDQILSDSISPRTFQSFYVNNFLNLMIVFITIVFIVLKFRQFPLKQIELNSLIFKKIFTI